MDEYTYGIKMDKIRKSFRKEDYESIVRIAGTINMDEVRDVRILNIVATAYEKIGDYNRAIELMLQAFEELPTASHYLYRIADLYVQAGDVRAAQAHFDMYVQDVPDDNRSNLLRYKILALRGAPVQERIDALKAYLGEDFDEEWGYHLAELYHEAGDEDKCSEMCNRVILYFGEGPFVDKALDLQESIAGLTPEQQRHRDNKQEFIDRFNQVQREFSSEQERPAEEAGAAQEPAFGDAAKNDDPFVNIGDQTLESFAAGFGVDLSAKRRGTEPVRGDATDSATASAEEPIDMSDEEPIDMSNGTKAVIERFDVPSEAEMIEESFSVPGEAEMVEERVDVPGEVEMVEERFAMPGEVETVEERFAMPGEAETVEERFAMPGEAETKNTSRKAARSRKNIWNIPAAVLADPDEEEVEENTFTDDLDELKQSGYFDDLPEAEPTVDINDLAGEEVEEEEINPEDVDAQEADAWELGSGEAQEKSDANADEHDANADEHDANADEHDANADKHDTNADEHDANADKHDANVDKHDANVDKVDVFDKIAERKSSAEATLTKFVNFFFDDMLSGFDDEEEEDKAAPKAVKVVEPEPHEEEIWPESAAVQEPLSQAFGEAVEDNIEETAGKNVDESIEVAEDSTEEVEEGFTEAAEDSTEEVEEGFTEVAKEEFVDVSTEAEQAIDRKTSGTVEITETEEPEAVVFSTTKEPELTADAEFAAEEASKEFMSRVMSVSHKKVEPVILPDVETPLEKAIRENVFPAKPTGSQEGMAATENQAESVVKIVSSIDPGTLSQPAQDALAARLEVEKNVGVRASRALEAVLDKYKAGSLEQEEPIDMKVLFIPANTYDNGVLMAVSALRDMYQREGRKQSVFAKIDAEKLNYKGLLASMPRLEGRDLIIESAGALDDNILREIAQVTNYNDPEKHFAMIETPAAVVKLRKRYEVIEAKMLSDYEMYEKYAGQDMDFTEIEIEDLGNDEASVSGPLPAPQEKVAMVKPKKVLQAAPVVPEYVPDEVVEPNIQFDFTHDNDTDLHFDIPEDAIQEEIIPSAAASDIAVEPEVKMSTEGQKATKVTAPVRERGVLEEDNDPTLVVDSEMIRAQVDSSIKATAPAAPAAESGSPIAPSLGPDGILPSAKEAAAQSAMTDAASSTTKATEAIRPVKPDGSTGTAAFAEEPAMPSLEPGESTTTPVAEQTSATETPPVKAVKAAKAAKATAASSATEAMLGKTADLTAVSGTASEDIQKEVPARETGSASENAQQVFAAETGFADEEEELEFDSDQVLDPETFLKYALQYAREIDCKVEDSAIEAIRGEIAIMIDEGDLLTVEEAEMMVEDAADAAERPSLKSMFRPRYTKDGRLILKGKHFVL